MVGPKSEQERHYEVHGAHLIAAAPDLYEALRWLSRDFDDMSGNRGTAFAKAKDAARAALAKARGEEGGAS